METNEDRCLETARKGVSLGTVVRSLEDYVWAHPDIAEQQLRVAEVAAATAQAYAVARIADALEGLVGLERRKAFAPETIARKAATS